MFAVVSPAPRTDAGGQPAGSERSLNEWTKAVAVITNSACLPAPPSPGLCSRLIKVIPSWLPVFSSHAGPGKQPGSGVKCPEPQHLVQTLALPLSTSVTLRDLSLLETSASLSLNWGSSVEGMTETRCGRTWPITSPWQVLAR